MSERGKLLAFVELGGYPDFSPLYRRLGYRVEVLTSGRKAIASIKKEVPAVLVGEFNYQRDFRDRTSALESVLAMVHGATGVKVVIFYHREAEEPLERLRTRFGFIQPLPYPITEEALEAHLRQTT